jgi:hypothetical protein
MWRKRYLILLCLSAGTIVAFGNNSDFVRRFKAEHIKETTIVSAGGRTLQNLFVDMPADPRWSKTRAMQLSKNQPHCEVSQHTGVWTKLASLLEGKVYAQSGCSATTCAGYYYIQGAPGQCGTSDCAGTFGTVRYDPVNGTYCTGNHYDGTWSCSGSGCNPPPGTCNVVTCDWCGGGGNCISLGQDCDQDDDQCCTGLSCGDDGTCEDSFAPVRH